MNELYTELGVNPGVDDATLKEAFRRRAQATHPDKGGAPGEFERVKEAYEVLSDPARRKSYDETGQTTAQPSLEEEAERTLVHIFQQYLESGDTRDPLTSMREVLKDSRSTLERGLKQADKTLAKLTKLQKSLRRRTAGPSMLTRALEAKIQSVRADQATSTRGQKAVALMTTMLEDWECVDWEEVKPSRAALDPHTEAMLKWLNAGGLDGRHL